MALFNDATQIDVTRFDRQDLKYGFGIILGEEGDPFLAASAQFQQKTLPNPKVLIMNPSSIIQDEPFAVAVTPTQDGGLVIEHRGQIVKNITAEGTTGFLPIQASLGIAGVSLPTGQLGKRSGYNEFLELRNLFKEYGRIKRTRPDIASRVKMVFLNGKDNENWIVEPRNFQMSRRVPSKTLYRYSVPMIAVARFETSRRPIDFIAEPGDISKTLQAIADASAAAEAFFKDLEATATLISGTVAKAVDDVLSPLGLFVTASNSVLNAQETILNIFPSNVKTITDNIYTFLEVEDASTTTIDPSLLETSLRTLNKLTDVLVRLDAFRSTFPTRWTGVTARWEKFGETMENRFRGQRERGSMTSVRQKTVFTGETIQRFSQRVLGDAGRFMDIVILNKLRPPYIVTDQIDRPIGTVAPGDSLLVPTEPTVSFKESPFGISLEGTRPSPTLKSTSTAAGGADTLIDTTQDHIVNQWDGFTVEITEGTGAGQTRFIESNTVTVLTVSPDWSTPPDATSVYIIYLDPIQDKVVPGADRVFGTDLLLAPDFDLRSTPESDLDVIRGIGNLSQAIDVKFFTIPGEVPLHPQLGFGQSIGSKGLLERLLTAKVNATKTFLSDSRIESVDEISLIFEDGFLQLTSKITPKDTAPKFVDLTLPG